MRSRFFAMVAGMNLCCLLTAQPADKKLPDGEGREVTERVCTACHDINTSVGARHDKSEWQRVVEDMASRGADATDSELKTIVDYLTKYFGPKASRLAR